MKPISYLSGLLLLTFLASCSTNHTTQSNHKQSLTDNTKIDLPVSEGIKNNYKEFNRLGFQKGEKVKNITLLSPDGEKVSLFTGAETNKPTLLISGSYTCDISRRNMADINALTARYKDRVAIYLVYTIDAHPADIPSPYSQNNRVEIAPANVKDHIEANQPKTYGERRALAKKWQQSNHIIAPVLIDMPTNDFWLNFGQAPNMAYLIDTDGTVYNRQTWFRFVDLDESIKDLIRSQHKNTTSP